MSVTQMRSSRMADAEWQTRVDLAACYRLVDLFGWSDLINTRITARGGHDHFLINRFGMLYDEITASSLLKIDAAGNKVDPSGDEINSGGFALPSTIHIARPDINCVIHTHTIAGCAVSMQKDGLLPLNQHALQVIGDIAYHDYEGTGRSTDERQRFLADFGDKHIMVLRNHGLFIIGRTIAEAFIATYRMERACAMQLAFQQSGAPFYPLSEAVVGAGYARSNARRRPRPRSQQVRLAGAPAQARPHRPVLQAIGPRTEELWPNRRLRAAVKRMCKGILVGPGPDEPSTSDRSGLCRPLTDGLTRGAWPARAGGARRPERWLPAAGSSRPRLRRQTLPRCRGR
jgi:ribulose-5-phosphate 4-epimerase/fuculose-1-phosphate aldolase